MVNFQQLAGAVRILIVWILSLVGSKLIPAEQIGPLADTIVTIVVNGVIPLVMILWSIFAHKDTTQIDNVSKMPEVNRVVASHDIANVQLKDNPKVTTQ